MDIRQVQLHCREPFKSLIAMLAVGALNVHGE